MAFRAASVLLLVLGAQAVTPAEDADARAGLLAYREDEDTFDTEDTFHTETAESSPPSCPTTSRRRHFTVVVL